VAFDELPIPFYINEQARVTINAKTISNAITIPLNTLKVEDGKEGVWTLIDNKAYFKELNIQAKGDNEAAIISGIKTEDIIIIPDSSKKALSEGMRINQ
jgi:hypothetical protein